MTNFFHIFQNQIQTKKYMAKNKQSYVQSLRTLWTYLLRTYFWFIKNNN
jgi:hypothetical protein